MPRSYRGIILAALGWLILAAAPHHATQPEQADTSQQASRALQAIAAAQNKIADATNTGEYQQPCGEGEDNNRSDLCAQWTAATAATEAARWAKWSLGVGIAGAIGIVIALGLTVHSNWIARDTAKRQLRAYLAVEPHGIYEREEDGNVRVPISIENCGQTPANKIVVHNWFTLVKDPIGFDPRDQPIAVPDQFADGSDVVYFPGTEHFVYVTMPTQPTHESMVAIAEKSLAIVHVGLVTYEDVFGVPHETRFAFYHRGDELSDVESMRCPFGNTAT